MKVKRKRSLENVSLNRSVFAFQDHFQNHEIKAAIKNILEPLSVSSILEKKKSQRMPVATFKLHCWAPLTLPPTQTELCMYTSILRHH